MCGIGGMVAGGNTVLGDNGTKIGLALMLSLQDRGEHAFGYMTDGATRYTDKHGTSAGKFFIKPKAVKRLMKDVEENKCLLMHTRTATHGDASENRNNHPFVTDNFTFAHNGVFGNYTYFLHEYCIDTNIETDSYAIIAAIEQAFQVREASHEGVVTMTIRRGMVRDAIAEIAGQTDSFACWLYDKVTHDTYLFRNGYPLTYLYDESVAIFASTKLLIEKAFKVYGMDADDMKEYLIKEGIIYRLNEKAKETKPQCVATFPECTYQNMPRYITPSTPASEEAEGGETDLAVVDDKDFISREEDLLRLNNALKLMGFDSAFKFDACGSSLIIKPSKNSYGHTPHNIFKGVSMSQCVYIHTDEGIRRVINALADQYENTEQEVMDLLDALIWLG